MKRIPVAVLLALTSACQSPNEYRSDGADTSGATLPQTRPTLVTKHTGAVHLGKDSSADTLRKSRSLALRFVAGRKTDFTNVRAEPEPRLVESSLIYSQSNGRVRREGSKLILTLTNSKTVVFTNDTYELRHDENEESDKYYSYAGQLSDLPYWVVIEDLYEAQNTFLINQQTGTKTVINGRLELSPNHQYLFAYYSGMVYEDDSHELQLFTIDRQSIRQVWQLSPKNWAPSLAHWLNDQTIAVKQMRPDSASGPVGFGQPSYIRLLLPN